MEWFGIEVNRESCLCGDALELASEASNGALWMGSYLQGFPFSVIRKCTAAVLAFIEQKASRLFQQGWEANLQKAVELATCDAHSPVTPEGSTLSAQHYGEYVDPFSMHVTCINDAE